MKTGRPSIYTQELADKICEQIATSSKSMKRICEELDVSIATVLNWLTPNNERYREEFEKQYTRAKEMQCEYLAEEILEIADDSSQDLKGVDEYGNRIEDKEFVNRSKVKIDARKWIASKLKPKKYGDKVDVTSGGDKIESQTVIVLPSNDRDLTDK